MGASFAAGVVLTGVGIYSLSITKNRKYLPLAVTPLLFGIQQLSEGGVWMGLHGQLPQQWLAVCVSIFMFFSQIFRVTWVPFMVRCIEKRGVRKNILLLLLGAGLALSAYLMYTLAVTPVQVMIEGNHIVYDYPPLIISIKWISVIVYMVVTIVSLFIARSNKLKMLGGLLFITAAISYLLYMKAFISVWCFFAAIISIYVVYIIKNDANRLE